MAENQELKKKSLNAIKKKFGDVKTFKAAFEKKFPDLNPKKLKKALADDREKGNVTYRKRIVDLLGEDIYNVFPSQKKIEKPKTSRQIKVEEEKRGKIKLTIDGLQKGEKIPKTAMFQINMSKSEIGTQLDGDKWRSEEHTSELQSHSFISYAV